MARRSGRGAVPAPLGQREGVDPVCLRLPEAGAGGPGRPADWPTIGAYLLERYGAAVGPARIDAMLAEGRFVTLAGPVGARTPYAAGSRVWFHRDVTAERVVPFPVEVVYRDERIVVADKPHFLATTPRGSHVRQTALARLRHDLGLPSLSPAHRLDRLTAGVVLLVVRPQDRGAYQTLFRDRLVYKEYEAVAAYDPAVELPRTVRSRIVKEHGRLAAQEVAGPYNAESRVELVEQRGGLGLYRLRPATGRTHQLRVHMNALGLPLLNDPLYPVAPDDDVVDAGPQGRPAPGEAARGAEEVGAGPAQECFEQPLQLLARTLAFTDPVTGRELRFSSARRLAGWPPGPTGSAGGG